MAYLSHSFGELVLGKIMKKLTGLRVLLREAGLCPGSFNHAPLLKLCAFSISY